MGADREPVAQRLTLIGSITWHETRPFDVRDLGDLVRHRGQLPGADDSTPLVVVSRAGAALDGGSADLTVMGPQDLVDAY